jgi:hypothetical protein
MSLVVYDESHINVLLYGGVPFPFLFTQDVKITEPITLTVFAVCWNYLRVFGDIDENGCGGGLAGLQFSL